MKKWLIFGTVIGAALVISLFLLFALNHRPENFNNGMLENSSSQIYNSNKERNDFVASTKEEFDTFPVRKEDFLSPPRAYGLWPYGIKGNDKYSHNEGHPGWDFELKNGAKLYAIGDIRISQIHDGDKQNETGETLQVIEAGAYMKQGIVNIVYHSVKNIEPYVVEGALIKEGTVLAEAGYPISDESVMIHFGIFAPKDSVGSCPSDFFSEKNNEIIDFMVKNSFDMHTGKPYESACVGKINKTVYYENFPERIQYIQGGEQWE